MVLHDVGTPAPETPGEPLGLPSLPVTPGTYHHGASSSDVGYAVGDASDDGSIAGFTEVLVLCCFCHCVIR